MEARGETEMSHAPMMTPHSRTTQAIEPTCRQRKTFLVIGEPAAISAACWRLQPRDDWPALECIGIMSGVGVPEVVLVGRVRGHAVVPAQAIRIGLPRAGRRRAAEVVSRAGCEHNGEAPSARRVASRSGDRAAEASTWCPRIRSGRVNDSKRRPPAGGCRDAIRDQRIKTTQADGSRLHKDDRNTITCRRRHGLQALPSDTDVATCKLIKTTSEIIPVIQLPHSAQQAGQLRAGDQITPQRDDNSGREGRDRRQPRQPGGLN